MTKRYGKAAECAAIEAARAKPEPRLAYECRRCDKLFVSPEPEPFCESCSAVLAARSGGVGKP